MFNLPVFTVFNFLYKFFICFCTLSLLYLVQDIRNNIQTQISNVEKKVEVAQEVIEEIDHREIKKFLSEKFNTKGH